MAVLLCFLLILQVIICLRYKSFHSLKRAEIKLLNLELNLRPDYKAGVELYYSSLIGGLKESFYLDEAGVLVFGSGNFPDNELSVIPRSAAFDKYLDMKSELMIQLKQTAKPVCLRLENNFKLYFYPLIVGSILIGVLFFSLSRKESKGFFMGELFLLFSEKQALCLYRFIEKIMADRRSHNEKNGRLYLDRMIEQRIPEMKDLSLSKSILPVPDISSDLCFFTLTLRKTLFFCLAESAADGVHATEIHVLFRTLWELFCRKDTSLQQLIAKVNSELYFNSAEAYLSGSFCHYRPETKTIEFLAAGHGEALLFRTRTSKLQELISEAPPLGTADSVVYRPIELTVFPGDILCLYSDGVIEARKGEDVFGRQRISELLMKFYTFPAVDIKTKILQELKSFRPENGQLDDESLMIVKIK